MLCSNCHRVFHKVMSTHAIKSTTKDDAVNVVSEKLRKTPLTHGKLLETIPKCGVKRWFVLKDGEKSWRGFSKISDVDSWLMSWQHICHIGKYEFIVGNSYTIKIVNSRLNMPRQSYVAV